VQGRRPAGPVEGVPLTSCAYCGKTEDEVYAECWECDKQVCQECFARTSWYQHRHDTMHLICLGCYTDKKPRWRAYFEPAQ